MGIASTTLISLKYWVGDKFAANTFELTIVIGNYFCPFNKLHWQNDWQKLPVMGFFLVVLFS